MFFYGNISSFFTKILVGLILLLLGMFVLASLISYDINDPGYGVTGGYEIIRNWGGLLGAQTSSIFLVFLCI